MTERRHIHFVTGKLAADALSRMVRTLASSAGFDYSIDVLPISVAALMTPLWIARHIHVPPQATEVILPGYCEGDTHDLARQIQVDIRRGPRDLRELPQYFDRPLQSDYGQWSIEILAEINHVPKLPLQQFREQALSLREDGADIIDVGCIPGSPCAAIGDYVRMLRDEGMRVSIDSFDTAEIGKACVAGAELVLSVNRANRDAALDWGAEVVAIPDNPQTLDGLEETAEWLDSNGIPYRLDPVLEPIGCGFAASLGRYLTVRQHFPHKPMMMGVGNLTELTDCDSAAMNVLLLGFCQELGVRSVLTTQVIPWARSSVRECNLARQLVHYAVEHGTIPKHIEPRLVMLRDSRVVRITVEEMAGLAAQITDNNFRLFADQNALHVISRQLHLQEPDPFRLFELLFEQRPETIDVGHAFYLGFELAKASIARTLHKNYRQDEALQWGLLTQTEDFHRLRRYRPRRADQPQGQMDEPSSDGSATSPGER